MPTMNSLGVIARGWVKRVMHPRLQIEQVHQPGETVLLSDFLRGIANYLRCNSSDYGKDAECAAELEQVAWALDRAGFPLTLDVVLPEPDQTPHPNYTNAVQRWNADALRRVHAILAGNYLIGMD